MTDEGAKFLATEIIKRACDDYMDYRKKQKKIESDIVKKGKTVGRTQSLESTKWHIDSIERFFDGEWCELLLALLDIEMSGKDIFNKLKERANINDVSQIK